MKLLANKAPAKARLLPLLEAIARGRSDFSLSDFAGAQIDWIIRSGLGPACFHAAKELSANRASPHWPALAAAELTARCIAEEQRDAMAEILDAARAAVPRLILLKGISVAQEFYPQFHWRPMRDIDLLAPPQSLAPLEGVLRALGYRQHSAAPPSAYVRHHHTMPFFHPQRRLWVEAHHHLISSKNRAAADPVFALAHVLAQARASAFDGRPVYRLAPELELVYLAAHWAQDLKEVGGMIAALDAIFLLRRSGARLDWEKLLGWLRDSAAAPALYLLLSYLHSRALIALPEGVLRRMALSRRGFGRWPLAAAHRIIDRCLLDGAGCGAGLSRRALHAAWNTLTLPRPPRLH